MLRQSLRSTTKGSCRALSRAASSNHQRKLLFQPAPSNTLLLGCVSYDSSVSDIWDQLKSHFVNKGGIPNFDYVLFSNYEQQVRALLNSHIDIA